MQKSIDEMLEIPKYRKALGEDDVYLFGAAYFSHYFTHAAAPFHRELVETLADPFVSVILWILYRESAKTAWARIFVVHEIVYQKRRNIKWVGHDLKKSRKNVLAIANELQTNKKIIQDFGQLYFEEEVKIKKSKPKQLDEFITENGVMVGASSTNISTRGDLQAQYRPDLYVIDDVENDETKASRVLTESIIEYIEELMSGVSVDCKVLVLLNRISTRGVCAYLEKRSSKNPDWLLYERKLIEHGAITWPGLWVATNEERDKINAGITNPKRRVKSIEQKKRDVGTARFNQEFLNQPAKEGGKIIKAEWIKRYSVERLTRDDKGNFYYLFDGDIAPIKASKVVIATDPAVSKKETSDERASVAAARFDRPMPSEDGKKKTRPFFLILRTRAGRWGLSQFAEELAHFRDSIKPHAIGVESNGVQEVFRESFQLFNLSTVALKPDVDKVRRLNRHVADIEFGAVLFPDDGSEETTENELVDFTGKDGGSDNRVDATVYALGMLKDGVGGWLFASLG